MRYSRHLKVGPGGVRCTCCFPRPGSKARRALFRQAKRLDKREAMKIETENSDGRAK